MAYIQQNQNGGNPAQPPMNRQLSPPPQTPVQGEYPNDQFETGYQQERDHNVYNNPGSSLGNGYGEYSANPYADEQANNADYVEGQGMAQQNGGYGQGNGGREEYGVHAVPMLNDSRQRPQNQQYRNRPSPGQMNGFQPNGHPSQLRPQGRIHGRGPAPVPESGHAPRTRSEFRGPGGSERHGPVGDPSYDPRYQQGIKLSNGHGDPRSQHGVRHGNGLRGYGPQDDRSRPRQERGGNRGDRSMGGARSKSAGPPTQRRQHNPPPPMPLPGRRPFVNPGSPDMRGYDGSFPVFPNSMNGARKRSDSAQNSVQQPVHVSSTKSKRMPFGELQDNYDGIVAAYSNNDEENAVVDHTGQAAYGRSPPMASPRSDQRRFQQQRPTNGMRSRSGPQQMPFRQPRNMPSSPEDQSYPQADMRGQSDFDQLPVLAPPSQFHGPGALLPSRPGTAPSTASPRPFPTQRNVSGPGRPAAERGMSDGRPHPRSARSPRDEMLPFHARATRMPSNPQQIPFHTDLDHGQWPQQQSSRSYGGERAKLPQSARSGPRPIDQRQYAERPAVDSGKFEMVGEAVPMKQPHRRDQGDRRDAGNQGQRGPRIMDNRQQTDPQMQPRPMLAAAQASMRAQSPMGRPSPAVIDFSRPRTAEAQSTAPQSEDVPRLPFAEPTSGRPSLDSHRSVSDRQVPSRNGIPNRANVERPNYYPAMGIVKTASPPAATKPAASTTQVLAPKVLKSDTGGRVETDKRFGEPRRLQKEQPRGQETVRQQPQASRPNAQGSGSSSQPAPKPAPVRHYNSGNDGGPSTQVLQEELVHLREDARRSPSDNATQFLLAKKLAQVGRALSDPKTGKSDGERYIVEARNLMKKLADNNDPDAMFFLADCYGEGRLGLANDPKEAFNLYQSAAKLGHPAAAYRTAVCCEIGPEEGGGTRKDIQKAYQWYKRASSLGDIPAAYKMGMILLKGLLGQPPNLAEAVDYLGHASRHADEENPHALHELGLLHESAGTSGVSLAGPNSGVIVHDEAKALQLYTQAAKLGYRYSQFKLGQAYEYGLLGAKIDPRNSIIWYTKGAAQGEHQSELALSGWYLTGSVGILEHSDTEAYLWARKAALSEPSLPKAMFAMGYFTEVGIGCPKSLDEAKKWYGRAAAYRFPKAQERLDELRKGGANVQRQREKLSHGNKKQEAECAVM